MRAPIKATAADRKLAAKRHNERLKLFAATANTIGLGILAAATIIPNFGQAPALGSPPVLHPWWTGPAAFLVLFFVALAAYRFLRSED